jgi:hypothetical protein
MTLPDSNVGPKHKAKTATIHNIIHASALRLCQHTSRTAAFLPPGAFFIQFIRNATYMHAMNQAKRTTVENTGRNRRSASNLHRRAAKEKRPLIRWPSLPESFVEARLEKLEGHFKQKEADVMTGTRLYRLEPYT